MVLPNWEKVVVMRLLGQGKLSMLKQINHETAVWLYSWVAEIKYAKWKCSEQVFDQYPSSVKELSSGSFEFFVGNQKISIVLGVNYAQSIAVIKEIKVRDHV